MPQVVGLRCPHCAAALPAEVGASSVKCAYCGTTSMLQRGGTIAGAAINPGAGGKTNAVGCLVGVFVLLLGAGVWLLAARPMASPPSPVSSVPATVVAQPAPPVVAPMIPAAPPPPTRTLEAIETNRRPLLVDVNGDAHPDIVALTQFSEGPRRWSAYAAHDSQTGAILWTVDVADDDLRGIIAAVAHGRLVLLTDKGQVHGHDLRTGAAQWTTALGERGKQMCAAQAADALEIRTLDQRVLQIDVRTGRQAPVAAIPECAPLLTDHAPNNRDPADRADPRAPLGTVAILCGGPSVYTSSGMTKIPDQCRQRSKVDIERLDGIVAHSLWQHGDGWLVLGVRKPGTYVPMLGFLDKQKKLAWKAEVPDGNPLLAEPGSPSPAILLGDRVIVGYTIKDQPAKLAAFALTDGARQWHIDVPGGKRVNKAQAADDKVFLYSDGSVHIIKPTDGSLVRTIGKP